MAKLTYRKSIKVAPGVRVNVTHRGVSSVSAGAKGLRLTQTVGGTRKAPTRAARQTRAAAPRSPSTGPSRKTLAWTWVWAVALFVGSFSAPLAFVVSVPLLLVAIGMTLVAAAPKPTEVKLPE